MIHLVTESSVRVPDFYQISGRVIYSVYYIDSEVTWVGDQPFVAVSSRADLSRSLQPVAEVGLHALGGDQWVAR